MLRVCGPLFDGDDNGGRGFCGVTYDDERRLCVCPHLSLAGGDATGIGPRARRAE